MFDPAARLIVVSGKANKSENLVNMMRDYHVPVGLNEEEAARANEYFEKKQKSDKKWYQVWKRKKSLGSLQADNLNSKVIYLMGPDNKFLQFYRLDIELNELIEQITEEISYDIGVKHIGTGTRPFTRV